MVLHHGHWIGRSAVSVATLPRAWRVEIAHDGAQLIVGANVFLFTGD